MGKKYYKYIIIINLLNQQQKGDLTWLRKIST